MTRATLIVAAYNVAPYLPRCLESVLAQTERSIQVVVVDDGSTDATPGIADRYAVQDPRIQVIHQENLGLSGARNAGLTAAIGEYVCFVDGDDWVEPGMVQFMTERCEASRSQAVIAGAVVDFHDESDRLTHAEIQLPARGVLRRGSPLGVDVVDDSFLNLLGYAWNKVYQREWLLGVGTRFEEGLTLVEDAVFNAQVLGAADRVALARSAFVHYVQRPRPSLGNARDDSFLALRWRAISGVDSFLEAWGVDEEARRRRRASASGLALWSALRAVANSPDPQAPLKRMLREPTVVDLVKSAMAVPQSECRGQWAAFTVGHGWYGLALLPMAAHRVIKRLAASIRRPSGGR